MTVPARATGRRPALWIVALAGFLARGGIVLLLLPMAPVPSTVGLATLVGPTSVTAAGLTAESALRLVAVVILALAWLLAANLVGAQADLATVEGSDPGSPGSADPAGTAAVGSRDLVRASGARRVLRLVALRLVALVPLTAAVAITARSVGELVYQELVQPRDVAAPLVLRVVEGALPQVAAIVLAWLLGETFGGIAVRLAIVEDRPFVRALAGAIAHFGRHPVAVLWTTIVGSVGLVVAIVPGLVVTAAAWGPLVGSFAGPIDGSAVVEHTVLFVAAWVAWTIIVAIVAAFRSALWTAEVASTGPPVGRSVRAAPAMGRSGG